MDRIRLAAFAALTAAAGLACAPPPDDPSGPPEPGMLVVAYSNLDGVDGYNPDTDALISKVMDTDDDGALSVGDTIVNDRYPLNFDATDFGQFEYATLYNNTHTPLKRVSSQEGEVRLATEGPPGYRDHDFRYVSSAEVDYYSESYEYWDQYNNRTLRTFFVDRHDDNPDSIQVDGKVPLYVPDGSGFIYGRVSTQSHPNTYVTYAERISPTDDPFIDVDFYVEVAP